MSVTRHPVRRAGCCCLEVLIPFLMVVTAVIVLPFVL
jgi:hypothetical protein